MKITILGCGASGGVPLIGGNWGACDPQDPRNRRLRCSILVEEGETTLLVDTSPDMRQQLLNCGLKNLTAVIYTHAHADHTHGVDDLRAVNWLMQKPVDIYADPRTLGELNTRFPYIFGGTAVPGQFYKPSVVPHLIEGPFSIGGIAVTPFLQEHGHDRSLGLRFNDAAYSTDVTRLDEDAFRALAGVKLWVVDCIREAEHPTHAHLGRALEWIARVGPRQAYLTHMEQTLDYARLSAKLPPGVAPAYDGLIVPC
jgi:phosphoribosyl 1,2-cyclic phosphate phosphodiesterase